MVKLIIDRRFPWVAQQDWHDVLFIHIPIDYNELRQHVPTPLKLESLNDEAWISVVLFKATSSRLRYMPRNLSFPSFFQMNIRTYVRFGDESGVYFFKINTNSQIVSQLGPLASMPFKYADLLVETNEEGFSFAAERDALKFKVDYYPTSKPYQPEQGTLAHFLTERYCIWMFSGGKIVKAPILHSNWDLHDADVNIEESTGWPFRFPENPLVHYAKFKHSMIYPFETFGKYSK